MLANEDLLKDMLILYLREDMNAWVSRRPVQGRPMPHCRPNQYPREVLESNLAQCLIHFRKVRYSRDYPKVDAPFAWGGVHSAAGTVHVDSD